MLVEAAMGAPPLPPPSSSAAAAAARSSLERMLDSIRMRDERTEGEPPKLPSRPTSRGRLPSSPRRPLPPVQSTAAGGGLCVEDCDHKKGGATRMASLFSKRETLAQGEMPELVSYEEREGSLSGETLDWRSDHAAAPDDVLNKIALMGDERNCTMKGILWAQKRVRGHQARHGFQELKGGATLLQSFVRGERARHEFEFMGKRLKAIILIQKHVKRWMARRASNGWREDIIVLQSVIRGWLSRKEFIVLKNLKMQGLSHMEVNRDQMKNCREVKDCGNEHPQVYPSDVTELQRQVTQAEAALRVKEEENVMLHQQIHRYEQRWSEYESKMESMEVTWQKQLTTLQINLAGAKKSLIACDMATQAEKLATSPDHSFYSEDTMSAETHTPQGTPIKQPPAAGTLEGTLAKQSRALDTRFSRKSDRTKNAISNLVEEFERRRQVFEKDRELLIQDKSEKSNVSMDPDDEIQKLKDRVASWQKDYKIRLRETKAALQKLGNSNSGKAHSKWWAIGCVK